MTTKTNHMAQRSPARTSPPRWRIAFDAVEREVTPRVEQLVRSEGFAQAVAAATWIESRARQNAERRLRRMWHAWNLPAATDVRRLSERVAGLERRVREVSETLADAG